MPNSLVIKADGSIELTDIPAQKASSKYKKFITDNFARHLPKTVFKSLAREDGGILHLLALYQEYLDFFEITEPLFHSCKNPYDLPSDDDLKRLNTLYAFFEELMFAGYDLIVLQAFTDNYDQEGLEEFLQESKIRPGSLLYDFTLSIYDACLPDLDVTDHIRKMKETAEKYPWFIHSRVFVMASRFGRSLSREAGISSNRDPGIQADLKALKDLLKENYPFDLKRGRVTGKKYVGVEKKYQRDLESMYAKFYFLANSMLGIVRIAAKHGVGREQIIRDLKKRYFEIGKFRCRRLSENEVAEMVYQHRDWHPSKVAKKLMAQDMDTTQYALNGLKLNKDLAVEFYLEGETK